MKVITIVDNFNKTHHVFVHAITELVPDIPNSTDTGAIELNNGHRIIVPNSVLDSIVDRINNEDNPTKKEKKNG
jgi:hypothetical protein